MTYKIGAVHIDPFAGGERTVAASWQVP